MSRMLSCLVVFCLFVCLVPASFGQTVRASVSSAGEQGNGYSSIAYGGTLSEDGRYAVFQSSATNLVAGDNNVKQDIFRHDTESGSTVMVSVNTNGVPGDGGSGRGAVSGDGRFVAFESTANNLAPDDTRLGTEDDILLADLTLGTIKVVNKSTGGVQGGGNCAYPAISADGGYVAFRAGGDDLDANDSNGQADIYLRNLTSNTTLLISVATNGAAGDGSSGNPSVSENGRYVAFTSTAKNLVPGDNNGKNDIFRRDTVLGITELVSVNTNGGFATNASYSCRISSDGRFVAFVSSSTDLAPGDNNGYTDAFLRDMQASNTVLVNLNNAGEQSMGGGASTPNVSRGGTNVSFYSGATNMVPGDDNGQPDVFVRNVIAATTIVVTVNSSGEFANAGTWYVGLSDDGSAVSFATSANNLVPNDTNGQQDVFIRRLTPASSPNGPPIATNDAADVLEGSFVAVDVLANDDDPEGDTLSITNKTDGTNGSVVINGGTNLTYTPTGDANGGDSFTYVVSDGNGGLDTGTVTITITPVNDEPSFTKGANESVNEDVGPQNVASWATAISAGPANESSQTVSFTVTNSNNGLFSSQPAVDTNGTLTYTPATNASGSATVGLYISDNGGTTNGGDDRSDVQLFTITVDPVDDPPTLVDDQAETFENSPVGILVLTNDVDIDSTLSVDSVTQGANGAVSNDNDLLIYTPEADWSGTDTFTYVVAEGDFVSTATVTVTVLPQSCQVLLQHFRGHAGVWGLDANGDIVSWKPIDNKVGESSVPNGWTVRDIDEDRVLLQKGSGSSGIWTLDTNGMPVAWAELPAVQGGWLMRSLDGDKVLLQKGTGGRAGIWTLDNDLKPIAWTRLKDPKPGWILRSLDGNRILLQQGTGGVSGLWYLDENLAFTGWKGLSAAQADLITRSLSGDRILVQTGATGASGFWMLDGEDNVTETRPLMDAIPGWTIKAVDN